MEGVREAKVTEGGKCRETEAGAESPEPGDAFCSWEYCLNQQNLQKVFLRFGTRPFDYY